MSITPISQINKEFQASQAQSEAKRTRKSKERAATRHYRTLMGGLALLTTVAGIATYELATGNPDAGDNANTPVQISGDRSQPIVNGAGVDSRGDIVLIDQNNITHVTPPSEQTPAQRNEVAGGYQPDGIVSTP